VKILLFIPLPFSKKGDFWQRDLGLVTLGLREFGADAWFVTLPGQSSAEEKFLLTPSRKEVADPVWWKKQTPDGIIINTWSSPRFHDIRRATSTLGCSVIEKLDTDGVKSPKIYPIHSLRRGLVDFDRRYFWTSRLPKNLYACLRYIGNGIFPFLIDTRMIHCMEQIPFFAAETPLAAERVRRFLGMYAASPMPKVVCIPHPVDTRIMFFPLKTIKSNSVVAVGRWHDAVKGWPLLERLARLFLRQNKEWVMKVIGGGSKELGRELENEFPGRFQTFGVLPHRSIADIYQEAKIYLLTSHSETFNIAGAEALCCGCSFVGPTQIPSSAYFCSANSGTVSHVRSPNHMLDALNCEAGEWLRNRRKPVEISSFWIGEVGFKAVAKLYLDLLCK